MLDHIPLATKVVLIKFWFAGVACFFISVLFSYVAAEQLILVAVLALVNGLVTALLTNTVIRFMESPDHDIKPWLLFYGKSYGSFCANLLYGAALTVLVHFTFYGINCYISWAIDPIGFGLLFVIYDMLFLQVKKLFVNSRKGK